MNPKNIIAWVLFIAFLASMFACYLAMVWFLPTLCCVG